jgi:2-polyprenyl-3-methyl-5-hydroxy-6-metoxy-1,4-benzoquinol methylase
VPEKDFAVRVNAFGAATYTVGAAINDKKVRQVAKAALTTMIRRIKPEMESTRIAMLAERCLELAGSADIGAYEIAAHDLLRANGLAEGFDRVLSTSAMSLYKQIKQYMNKTEILSCKWGSDSSLGGALSISQIKEGNVLGLGCGGNPICELLRKDGYNVTVMDTYKVNTLLVEGESYPTRQGQGPELPLASGAFDTTIALSVFHHSDKIGDRIIVVESVYGIKKDGYQNNGNKNGESHPYLNLDAERQHMLNVFFDHFCSRIINYTPKEHNKVNIPFNFNTQEGWTNLLERANMRQEKLVPLGINQDLSPEYRTLHILRAV